MKNKAGLLLLPFICLLLCSRQAMGQSNTAQPTTLYNTPQNDTNANKSNTSEWKDATTRITVRKLNSAKTFEPDQSIHTFHRRPFSQPWYRNLGNLGSPTENLLFTPEDRLGPTLGYHVFDVYRFMPDSMNYYNTTHPYAAFTYQLGSKLEQMAQILYTQNIKPNWNFAFNYHKINSPGYYKIQRTNHDNVCLTTNYQSQNLHYELYGAVMYNKFQQDENGGILYEGELDSSQYSDRRTIGVLFANDGYSVTRSSVTNMQRDFTLLFQHSYKWGETDTTYNADSTHFSLNLVPRFSITHKLEMSTEKYQFKDVRPDSVRYANMFQQGFASGDSVFMEQKWFWVDNKLLLNSFFGPAKKQLEFNAGIGNRFDGFLTTYITGFQRNKILSNYLVGEIKKEALAPGQWFYHANAKLFLTGDAAGDFLINAQAGKDLNNNWGSLTAGFRQQLNNAPYNYTIYENQYYNIAQGYNKESVTQFYGMLESPRLKLSGGLREYVISNYIYIDQNQQFAQDASPFSVTQIWGRKALHFGSFVLDNELVYQQLTGDAPVNVPAILGRNQLSLELSLFNNHLQIATGAEIRYHTPYYCAGYDPFFNRFYYQNSYYLTNAPSGSLFFNFKIKSFRAYIMGDQLQQIFTRNIIAAPGYPAQNAMLRFGFTWVMIN